jgi:hypothetical protein
MKAILEFNLPEEEEEFKMATQGQKLYVAIHSIEAYLRSKTKHAPDSMSDDTYKAYQDCREDFYRILNEYNIDLE